MYLNLTGVQQGSQAEWVPSMLGGSRGSQPDWPSGGWNTAGQGLRMQPGRLSIMCVCVCARARACEHVCACVSTREGVAGSNPACS